MYRIKASHLKIVKETIRVNNIDKDQQRQFDSLFRALKYSIAMGNCQKFKETHNEILQLMPDLDIDQYYTEQDLSCAAGEYTIPYISVYGASKQFLDVFTRSLNIETNKNIDILSVKPLKDIKFFE
ncbi:hypothetical protein PPERSA_11948 [Pseudocohnilembus persalinus]|uniref:Uncharacterized protein n=1 Tax=Pseudocohnilembus persalinus TaxID=266149 RepID=A0A0V0QKL7_PSEPJ|nr:hypothetical protein PPERSA_11948 [Pseudocohnilembus persalinus]|eukprot:KRX02608.1 hypothetical protein PPERSA_11948 [Pseudocohnilembus persalinus]